MGEIISQTIKEFDIEAAKDGAKVCTRDGYPVRIIYYDRKGTNYPIVALVDCGDNTEGVMTYTIDGKSMDDEKEHNEDLMIASVHHEGWTNVFKDKYGSHLGGLCPNKEAAEKAGLANDNYVTSIKVEWDE